MKRLNCILIILISVNFGFSQSKIEIVNAISKNNTVECEIVGYSADESKQYKRYTQLSNICNKRDLQKLIEHDSSAVKAYASKALIENGFASPDSILNLLINSTDSVWYICGCIGSLQPLPEFIYEQFWTSQVKYIPSDDYHSDNYKVTDSNNLLKMDSIILFNYLEKKTYFPYPILENRVYPKSFNSIIAKWAFEMNDVNAIEYLTQHELNEYQNQILMAVSTLEKDPEITPNEKRIINLIKRTVRNTNDNKR